MKNYRHVFVFILFIGSVRPVNAQGSGIFSVLLRAGNTIKITPVEFAGEPVLFQTGFNPNFYTFRHKNLTGAGINLGIQIHHRSTNLAFDYSQTYRYDHVFYEIPSNSTLATGRSVNQFFLEHHFMFLKYFGHETFQPYVMVGFSFLNNNVSYQVTYQNITSTIDLSFTTGNAGLGVVYRNFELEAVFYYVVSAYNPFSVDSRFSILIPELKLCYRLPVLNQ